MNKLRLKTGDQVKVIAGKDKGKTGKIMQVFASSNKVVVEGVNVMKKHLKSRGQKEKGRVIELSAPLNISNVMLMDPAKNAPTRVRLEVRDGHKVRIAKKSGEIV